MFKKSIPLPLLWFQVLKVLPFCRRRWGGRPLVKPHLNLLQTACLVLEDKDGDCDEADVNPGEHGREEKGDRPTEEEERGGQAQRLHIHDYHAAW